MREYKKKKILQTVNSLIETNEAVEKGIKTNPQMVADTLGSCQEAALVMGTYLETFGGEYAPLVRTLEDYCENLYQVSVNSSDETLCRGLLEKIRKQLEWLGEEVRKKLPDDRKEVVFLPYKASMWDSLETIWKAAKADPAVDALVIPIPYYSKNPDGSLREAHYEGDRYPDYVPVMDYKEYDFKERRPDITFIHNPYDNGNKLITVHPSFFSYNLKKYTEKLVYVPYYVVPWSVPEDYIVTAGVAFADLVFVQSETIKKQYVKTLGTKLYHGENKCLENKIIALGSPKTDKVLLEKKNGAQIPEEWKRRAGDRKIVFFNTNVSLLLNNGTYFIENLYRIFHIFETYKEKFVLLWREHPLTMEMLHSMFPDLLSGYQELRRKFQEKRWGILDETAEPHLAMAVSDCYFGAGGSLVTIYSATGKPMLVTAYHYPEEISEKEITKEEFYASLGKRSYYKEQNVNALRLFLENYEEIAEWKEHRIEVVSERLANLDGTVGKKIYQYVMDEGEI
ncbi:MAG: hypothetical protein HFI68_05710 [Lachnospiraceae bacterium]|nr:hypothetical protein [Lachnospiraceae bacterium]